MNLTSTPGRVGLRPWCLALLGSIAFGSGAAAAAEAASCSVRSGDNAPRVVELYTSEGCNSCPPADRWLSTLKGRDDVVALAFHVDYWDRLGWIDRFASPAWTQRQSAAIGRSGSSFAYTPQVLINGRDDRHWPALPAAVPAEGIALEMQREGAVYTVRLSRTGTAAPRALAGYWAVTEDGHRTQVRAGENAGVTLNHDAVVRELQPVPDLDAGVLRFTPQPPTAADRAAAPRPRTIVFVATDARTQRPLQAVKLGC